VTPEDDRLVSVALSLLDGESVDWGRVAGALPDAEQREVAAAMRALQPILSTPVASGGRALEAGCGRWSRLQLLERIGGGTGGDVYRAWDARLSREVALKLLHFSGDGGGSAARLDEARRLARIRHVNVATVHGADLCDGRVGLWMELVQGRSLSTIVTEQGRFGAREAALVGLELCRALAAVHAAGLLHCDLKADNVMREDGGRIVLVDFGAGIDQGVSSPDVSGTPVSMAPEVLAGEAPSASADLYSLGVLLFHLLTGSYPVEASSLAELRAAHEAGRRRLLRDARPDLPAALVAVVERALGPSRSRYQSPGQMERALGECLGATPRRRPLRMAAAVAAAVAVTAALGAMKSANGTRPVPQAGIAGVVAAAVSAPAVGPAPVAPPSARLSLAEANSSRALESGDRVSPGDRLFLEVRSAFPVYAYVVNEDERGEADLLFPLPHGGLANPLAPGLLHHLPGPRQGQALFWQVTSAGGREHVLVLLSRRQLPALEEMIRSLRVPQLGRPLLAVPLPRGSGERLRGIGALVVIDGAGTAPRVLPLARRLAGEAGEGPWLREVVLQNPS